MIVLLPSAEIGILTPYYTMHPETFQLDSMEGYNICLMQNEPAGYILEVQDIVQPFGPKIIDIFEVLGEL